MSPHHAAPRPKRTRFNFTHRFLAVCALALCLSGGGRNTISAQKPAAPDASSPAALTPLQREIEVERARLASSDQEERRDAVLRLGAMARPESSRAASAALRDPSALVRATAARAILSLPSAESAALLLPLLGDRDEFVRRETAYALGRTMSRAGVSALIIALERDKNAGVRGAAAVALGQIGDPAAVPALAESLSARSSRARRSNRRKAEENEFVRRAAAVALGQIKSSEAVPALITALADERAGDDVRREAARALSLIGDVRAVEPLRGVLTARDPYLSRIAYEALLKLDPSASARPD